MKGSDADWCYLMMRRVLLRLNIKLNRTGIAEVQTYTEKVTHIKRHISGTEYRSLVDNKDDEVFAAITDTLDDLDLTDPYAEASFTDLYNYITKLGSKNGQ